MRQEIIVNANPKETRVAVLEDGRLMELYIQRSDRERLVGNIYKGKVENVLPGMQAAFVDIGIGKNAFLHLDDVLQTLPQEGEEPGRMEKKKISEILHTGQEVVVQVNKEPVGTKGPRITTKIALPGRYIVFMPYAEHAGISRRIEEGAERERLKKMAEQVCQSGGMIVRTAAEGIKEEQIRKDYKFLQGLWKQALLHHTGEKAPCLLYRDLDLVARSVRDLFTEDTHSFVIDHPRRYHEVCTLLSHTAPELTERVQLYERKEPIFKHYQIEAEIERAMKRKVWLKSGGYLVIDQTEALTAIDVNTGKFVGSVSLEETVLKINRDAAREIARQLRLRDIGGMIIIDFIDMEEEAHRKQVLAELELFLKQDRTRTHVLGLTKLGLVEMTRKKIRQSLDEVLQKPCPCCEGTGKIDSEDTVASRIERELGERIGIDDIAALLVEAHPSVAAHLIGPGGKNLDAIERKLGKRVYVKGQTHFSVSDFQILQAQRGEDVEKWALPVCQGQILQVFVEEPHTYNPQDGIARVEGFIIDVGKGGMYVGQEVSVKIMQVFRTYAKAMVVGH